MNLTRSWLMTGGVGVAGLLAGVTLASTIAADAETTSGTSSSTPAYAAPFGDRDGDGDMGDRAGGPAGERPLTGTTAGKVKAAALTKYPGATVVRLETDSDGVFEAHLTKADGTPVTVEIDKSYQVTGEEAGGFGHGGPATT